MKYKHLKALLKAAEVKGGVSDEYTVSCSGYIFITPPKGDLPGNRISIDTHSGELTEENRGTLEKVNVDE